MQTECQHSRHLRPHFSETQFTFTVKLLLPSLPPSRLQRSRAANLANDVLSGDAVQPGSLGHVGHPPLVLRLLPGAVLDHFLECEQETPKYQLPLLFVAGSSGATTNSPDDAFLDRLATCCSKSDV